jgi:hypothetical protein
MSTQFKFVIRIASLIAIVSAFATTSAHADQVITFSSGFLTFVDTQTGAQKNIAPISFNGTQTGVMSYNPISRNVFFIRNNNIESINVDTGQGTSVSCGFNGCLDLASYFDPSIYATNATVTSIQNNGTTYLRSNATGGGALATGPDSLAFGSNAQATNNGSIAVGLNSSSTGVNSIAIGTGASATAAGSVAIGSGSVATAANTVSVGSAGNERRITNVAPGIASTDAANVGQLQTMSAGFQNQITGLQGQINVNQTEARRGIAAAVAINSATTPSAPGKTTVSLTSGFFHGETGVGVAVAHRLKTAMPIIVYGGYANSGGENIGRVGTALEF